MADTPGCYDAPLTQILHLEGTIIPFLDVFFGFLHRHTDFYHEDERPSTVGFPPGVAEQLVVTTFRKWRAVHQRSAGVTSDAAEEEVVTSPAGNGEEAAAVPPSAAAAAKQRPQLPRKIAPTASPSDSHNGAVCDGFSWSQTFADLTVRVPVPPEIRRARQVSVELRSDRVSVRLSGGGELMGGRLHRAVQADESTWSLLPGDSVQLSLEKVGECWWTALLEREPQIELGQIEAVKPWEELTEEEQVKVSELRARKQTKRIAVQSGTVAAGRGEEQDVSDLLQEAWDAEGSPFRRQPCDPTAEQTSPGTDRSS